MWCSLKCDITLSQKIGEMYRREKTQLWTFYVIQSEGKAAGEPTKAAPVDDMGDDMDFSLPTKKKKKKKAGVIAEIVKAAEGEGM